MRPSGCRRSECGGAGHGSSSRLRTLLRARVRMSKCVFALETFEHA
jgi:hypothetical protein